MKQVVWSIMILSSLLWGLAANAQDECAAAFADAQNFVAAVYEKTLAEIEGGSIPWESADWENVVRRVVGTSEFYLNNCTDADHPLSEQTDAVARLAEMSLIQPPVESVDVGGDFGEVTLGTDFEPSAVLIDLNGDGTDELLLHTQVPYFSEETVYAIRGGLSIAFFYGEDGWQGQVIAPVSSFVTDQSGDHLSYAMLEDNTLSVEQASDALVNFPAPEVEALDVDGTALTFVTLRSATGTGEAKELAVLTWDGRIPSVELRVSFNDWCYPGAELSWEIREDGSVFVPSNGGEEGSPLHCGRTPEVLFQWEDGQYVAIPAADSSG